MAGNVYSDATVSLSLYTVADDGINESGTEQWIDLVTVLFSCNQHTDYSGEISFDDDL